MIKKFFIISILFFFSQAHAERIACGLDTNGNGSVDESEYKNCSSNGLCPINKVKCSRSELKPDNACVQIPPSSSTDDPKYQCNIGVKQGQIFDDKNSCVSSCVVYKFTSPYGSSYSCIGDDYEKETSNRRCVDLDAPVVEDPEVIEDNTAHDNDGRLDANGQCLDQLYIFSGRPMRCKRAGIQTAFQNCCSKNDGTIYFDGKGSTEDKARGYLTTHTVVTTLKASKAAFLAYNTAIQAGQSVSLATQAAKDAATQVLTGAFDPTSLAISLAIYLITDWIANACDQQSTETASLRKSGFCVSTGNYCKKRWRWVGCVQRVNTYCCFNSKLAVAFHTQGRPQLKSFTGQTGFGDRHNPNCRGFTPEEFQSLDFGQIDLTGYTNDLRRRFSQFQTNGMGNKVNDYINNNQN